MKNQTFFNCYIIALVVILAYAMSRFGKNFSSTMSLCVQPMARTVISHEERLQKLENPADKSVATDKPRAAKPRTRVAKPKPKKVAEK